MPAEREHLTEYAQQVGVDHALFDACLASRKKEAVVRRDQEEGRSAFKPLQRLCWVPRSGIPTRSPQPR